MAENTTSQKKAIGEISCPHCCTSFPPHLLHYIARHPELSFDHFLKDGSMRRFLPSNFTFQGDAIDPRGEVCTETACPHCHLEVPRILALREMVPISVFGSPSSGKSYFLGSMTHCLRTSLPRFGVDYDDVNSDLNAIILDYERRMYQQPTSKHWVWLEKTDLLGQWYSEVWLNGIKDERNKVLYPKPFLFNLATLASHPSYADGYDASRVLCIYDNAGEHFQTAGVKFNEVTGHLKYSQGMVFVFDPTQDRAFREACRGESEDTQFTGESVDQQDVLLSNVLGRTLGLRSMQPTDRLDVPIVVAITKFDAWKFLLGEHATLPAVIKDTNTSHPNEVGMSSFDIDTIKNISDECRKLLLRFSPNIVHRLDSRCNPEKVFYIPVSATGCAASGVTDSDLWHFEGPVPPDGYNYFCAGDIKPIWGDVPVLTLLTECAPGLLSTETRHTPSPERGNA